MKMEAGLASCSPYPGPHFEELADLPIVGVGVVVVHGVQVHSIMVVMVVWCLKQLELELFSFFLFRLKEGQEDRGKKRTIGDNNRRTGGHVKERH